MAPQCHQKPYHTVSPSGHIYYPQGQLTLQKGCWSSITSVFQTSRKKNGTKGFFSPQLSQILLSILSKGPTRYVCFHSFGQNFVMLPHLATRKAGKCSLGFIIKEKGKNEYWRAISSFLFFYPSRFSTRFPCVTSPLGLLTPHIIRKSQFTFTVKHS